MQLIRELERKKSVSVFKETTNVSGKGRVGLYTLSFLLQQLVNLPQKAEEVKADVILFSSMVTASLSYFVRGRLSIPMVTINHGRDVTLPVGPYQWFLPKVFSSLDGIISVSQATRRESIKRGMDASKGVALPNGFDLKILKDLPEKSSARSYLSNNFGISLKDRYMLLTVGRQVKRKGHEWFIRNVLPNIKSQVVYVTIGDGPEINNIRQAVQESDVKDRIHLLGRQPDKILKKAYAAADLFIMPNIPVEGDMEGFGIVLLEANMSETPALASDLEGIKDVITDGKNGYRIPDHEPELFANKVDELLSGNLKKFSAKTREHVTEQFSWQAVADQYVAYLEQVINRY